MTDTINLFAAPAATLATSAVAFIDANRNSDKASTPFARSALAAVVGGLSSLSMVETVIIAAMGSPKSPKTGKPVAKVSGLRDMDGGARLYQAWKAIADIVDNIDADAPAVIGEGEAATSVGNGAIRALVEGFILEADGAPKALFGATGLHSAVKSAMTDHAKAIAKAMGVEAEGETNEGEGQGEGQPNGETVSLTDRANAFLVALRAAGDDTFTDAQEALAMLSDYIDSRWNAIADATAPADEVAKAA